MNEKKKDGLKAIEAALLLGILGDGLLHARPWGLNVLLWTGALTAAIVVVVARRRQYTLKNGGHWLLLTALLFAAAFGWRDSRALNLLAGLCSLAALALIAWRAREGRIWLASFTEYLVGLILTGMNVIVIGLPMLFGELNLKEITRAGWSGRAKAVVRGLLLAVPLLALFGALFASADAGFERIITRLFLANHDDVLGHLFVAFSLTWISGGFLRSIVFGQKVTLIDGRVTFASSTQPNVFVTQPLSEERAPDAAQPEPLSLGIVEMGITLGLLNLLFLTFVLLQLRYFFGGAALVQGSQALTYAEYYRRGFFELVTVALLVLPILLTSHWLLNKREAGHERIFRLLAGIQVMLVFVIMVSAVRRMLLYQSEYGLTELRLYTTAFMVWLGLVFVWFSLTVLRGRRDQFACGALIAGFLIVGALHLVNPDALIVRVNVAHAQAGRSFDAEYASSLSADGVPALIEALPLLNPADRRKIIETRILGSASVNEGSDWRTWNWSRARAREAVRKNLHVLREISESPRDIGQFTSR